MDERVLDVAWPIRFCIVNFAILPSRPKQSAEAYHQIWTPAGSPLVVISKNVARIGGTLTIDAETLARVVLAANDGITLDSHIDGQDLYRPYLQLVMSAIEAPQ